MDFIWQELAVLLPLMEDVAEEFSEISAGKLVPDVLVMSVEGMFGMDTRNVRYR